MSNPVIYMVFGVGLVLLILGFVMMPITEEETRYKTVYGFQVPYKVKVHPYQELGIGLAFFGFILIVASIYSKFKSK